MKKFFLNLIILAVFSGFVFYTGWTQIKVDTDTVGVIVSKTSGIDEKPAVSGEFSWHWQFLLPTNASIKKFSIKPLSVDKKISGQLPSSSVYSKMLDSSDLNGDAFSYSFDFSITVSISPEYVVELYSQNIIKDSQSLEDYLNGAASTVAQLASGYCLSRIQENRSFLPENIRRDELLKSIQIDKEFPLVDVTVIALNDSRIPDYKLYESLQTKVLNQDFTNDIIVSSDSLSNASEKQGEEIDE